MTLMMLTIIPVDGDLIAGGCVVELGPDHNPTSNPTCASTHEDLSELQSSSSRRRAHIMRDAPQAVEQYIYIQTDPVLGWT